MPYQDFDTVSTTLLLEDDGCELSCYDESSEEKQNHTSRPAVSVWMFLRQDPTRAIGCPRFKASSSSGPPSSEDVKRRMLCLEIFLLLNTIFAWITGLVCVGLGVWLRYRYAAARVLVEAFDTTFSLVIGTGFSVLLLGFMGLTVIICRKKMLTYSHTIVVGLLFSLSMYTMWHVVLMSSEVHSDVQTGFRQGMSQYQEVATIKKAMDTIQREYVCCGEMAPSDWLKFTGTSNTSSLPLSCCPRVKSTEESFKFTTQSAPTVSHRCTVDDTASAKNKLLPTANTKGCLAVMEESFSWSLQLLIVTISLMVFFLWLTFMAVAVLSRFLCRISSPSSSPNSDSLTAV